MAKMKTRKCIAKRVRKTASGKLKRKKANLRHKLGKMSAKRKRKLGKATYVSKGDMKRIKDAIVYL